MRQMSFPKTSLLFERWNKDIIEASPDETIFVDANREQENLYLINKINYMVSELEVNPKVYKS